MANLGTTLPLWSKMCGQGRKYCFCLQDRGTVDAVVTSLAHLMLLDFYMRVIILIIRTL
jgi:hypothetical protein